ncbi:MAG: MaoC family dehydratase N-terminal domain-containing protein [Actinomycetota bacterium]
MIDHKFIGKEYPPDVYEIGREKMREYARAIGETSPYYHDTEFGRSSAYGDNIAPPSFAAVYNLLGAAKFFFDPEIQVNFAMLVHGEQEFEYLKPVKAGDVITSTGRIVDIAEKGNNDVIKFEARSVNQDGDLVTIGRATFVVRGGN